MGVHRTRGAPDEIKKNTHPKTFTALFCEQVTGEFTRGRHFGAVPMILGHRTAADIVAETVCDLYMLEKKDLDEVLSHYSGMKTKIEANAQQLIDGAFIQYRGKSASRDSRSGGVRLSDKHKQRQQRQRHSLVTRNSESNGSFAPAAKQSILAGHDVVRPSVNPHHRRSTANAAAANRTTDGGGGGGGGGGDGGGKAACLALVAKAKGAVYVAWERAMMHHFWWRATGALLSVIFIAFEAAFVTKEPIFIVLSYLLDVALLTDTSLMVLAEWKGRKTNKLTNTQIAWHASLVVGDLPIEIIAVCAGATWGVVARVRLNRLLRWLKVKELYKQHQANMHNWNFGTICFNLAIMILLTIHLMACLWFVVICPDPESCQPSQYAGSTNTTATMENYVSSIYWSVATLTSTGYGDVHASTRVQYVASMLGMLLGQVLFGTALATIAATLGNSLQVRVEYKSKVDAVKSFLRDQNVSTDLCRRVEAYYEDHWLRYQGHVAFEHIEGMPKTLHAEICCAKYSSLLQGFPLFRQSIQGFTRDLAFDVRRMLVLPGELVVHKGDIGKEMYFIMRGVAEILASDDERTVTEICEGAYFGEVGMLFQTPRCNSVRAKTHCELLVLTNDNLFQATSHYPAIRQIIENVRHNREHFEAIKSAVRMNDTMAMPADMDFAASLRHDTFVRNRERTKRNLVAPLSASPLSVGTLVDLPAPTHRGAGVGGGGSMVGGGNDGTGRSVERGCGRGRGKPSACPGVDCVPLMPYTLVPSSRFAAYWEGLMMLLAVATSFTLGFQAAFLYGSSDLLIFHYAVDALFLLDMFLKFHTAYFDERGMLITHQRHTAWRYLQTNFWLDFIASLPLELLSVFSPARTMRLVCVLRINRALRAYRIIIYLSHLERSITQNAGRVGFVRFAFLTVITTHWIGCGWFILGCFNTCSTGSWATSGDYTLKGAPWLEQYAITKKSGNMFSGGYVS